MRWRIAASTLALATLLTTSAFAQERGAPSNPTPPPAPASPPRRIRIGGNVQSPRMTYQVQPVYPQLAKAAHIEGIIVLHAVIAKEGSVKELAYVSGPPLLMGAAMDAVRQWRYEATLLNGQPVEVDTTISVIFTLGGQTPPPEQAIDPQLRADILRMLDVTHSKENMADGGRRIFESMRPSLIASLPPTAHREQIADALSEKLLALLQSPETTDRVVAIYAKYLTDDDIKALIEFYRTPAGQHFNAALPQLMGEVNVMARHWAEDMSGIWRELCKEYPELEGTKVCAQDETPKKSLLLEKNFVPSDNLLIAAGERPARVAPF
jgi:TonB family protein